MPSLLDRLAEWLFPFWISNEFAARCRAAAQAERDGLKRLTILWTAGHWSELSRQLSRQSGRAVSVTSLATLLPHVSVPVRLASRTVGVACADGPSLVRYTPAPDSLRLDCAVVRRLIAAVVEEFAASASAAIAAQFMKQEQERARTAATEAAAGLARRQAAWNGLCQDMAAALSAGAAAQHALDRRRTRLAKAQQALQAARQAVPPILQELEARQERRRLAAEAIFEPGRILGADDAKRLAVFDARCGEQMQALGEAEAAMQAAAQAIKTEHPRIAAAREAHAKAAAGLGRARSAAAKLAASLRAEASTLRDAADVATETRRVSRDIAGYGADGPALLAQLKVLAPWTLTPVRDHDEKKRHLGAVEALLAAVEEESTRATLPPLVG